MLAGTFCILKGHLYVSSGEDATLLKLQGFVRTASGQIDLTLVDRPLVETDLIAHQHSLKLKDRLAWLRSRLHDRYPDHRFVVRGKMLDNRYFISVEPQLSLTTLLDPAYHMQFGHIGSHWCRYMIRHGFSQEGRTLFNSITENLLPFEWQRGKTQFIFGAPCIPHLRLTVEAPLDVWEMLEKNAPNLPRTLTWNRRHIHVFSEQDEAWLRSKIGDRVVECDRRFSGSMFRC